jgi:hypothetical protein
MPTPLLPPTGCQMQVRATAALVAFIAALCCAITPQTADAVTGLSWSAPTAIDTGNSLTSMACPYSYPSTVCIAADDAGNVLSTTNPSGGAGAWTTAHIDGTNALAGVSCGSAGCVAVDDLGNAITANEPTASASAWTAAAIDPANGGLTGAACPVLDITSVSFCVTVDQAGNVLASAVPAHGASSWTSEHVDAAGGHFTGVSCVAFASLCVAFDDLGNIAVSTEPLEPGWTLTHIDTNGLTSMSCEIVLVTTCVATDTAGNVITSSNPSGGAGAWTPSAVDSHGLAGVSCAFGYEVPPLCGAVDDAGDALTSTNPLGGASTWASTSIDGTTALTAISCPSIELCVAADSQGNVLTGIPSPPAKEEKPSGGGGSGGSTGGGGSPPSSTSTSSGSSTATASVSAAQIASSLGGQLVPRGKAAKIGALLRHGGLTMPFQALEAGRLAVQWYYVPVGAKLARASRVKPVLVASGRLTFSGAGMGTVRVKLTAAGRRVLRHVKRVRFTVKGTFAPSGGRVVSSTGPFVASR